jgi:crotonobetainyl-CoA:carnitine CoA-transferase CaiB-like acyl-CoA transferase
VPHQAFATQTRWIAVAAHTDEEWRYLCRALELDELANHSRFATNAARVAHRQELIPLLQKRFREKPALWWLTILGRYRVPCGLFMGYPELRHHQQVGDNEHIVTVETERGPFPISGLPWRFGQTPCTFQSPTEPGQYTQAIIRRTGRDPATIPGAMDESPKFVDVAAQTSRPF